MTYAAFRSHWAYIPPKIMTNADFEKSLIQLMSGLQKELGIKEKNFWTRRSFIWFRFSCSWRLQFKEQVFLKKNRFSYLCYSNSWLLMYAINCLFNSIKVGLPPVMAFDISAVCTGFVYAVSIAKAFIESGMKKMF